MRARLHIARTPQPIYEALENLNVDSRQNVQTFEMSKHIARTSQPIYEAMESLNIDSLQNVQTFEEVPA